jgi:amino acid transporter
MIKKGYSFGTFQGVFVPSILTIMGVIMYLRFGWVLAHTGLAGTLVIVALGTSITLLTSLSLGALVSNSPVGGGGAYYIISRSLGIEAGAAIGFPLYCAQAIGIAFYTTGFAESINALAPALPVRFIALAVLVLLTLIVWYSADLALKTQYFVLALIAFSLLSFFLGDTARVPPVNEASMIKSIGFWAVFAVFFPAVTGIEAGLGLSGDLKNPARSLTWGTLAAVLVSTAFYVAIPLFLSHTGASRAALDGNNMVIADIARWKWLVIAGIWGATLSSAMGTLLSAPRTLQAMCGDRLLPRFIGRGAGPNNDPRVATVISFLIAGAGILLGDLNAIAPVLTMFFLTSYGLINVSASMEGLVGSPWWRPRFKIPWFISGMGAFICFAAMFMINPGATFIAIFFSLGLYAVVRRRRLKAQWGDARTGILMWIAQNVIYRLASRTVDERTWRPSLLVLTSSPRSRLHLVSLTDALTNGRGFATFVSMVPRTTPPALIEDARRSVSEFLLEQEVEGIVKICTADDFISGARSIMEIYGYGPIRPNTVVLGSPRGDAGVSAYAGLLRHASQLGLNVIIVHNGDNARPPRPGGRVDVWWDQTSSNAGLLLALGHLLCTSRAWRKSELTVRTIMGTSLPELNASRVLNETMKKKMRLDGQVIVEHPEGDSHLAIIRRRSFDADFILMGLAAPEAPWLKEPFAEYFAKVLLRTAGLPPMALVMAREKVKFDHLFSS